MDDPTTAARLYERYHAGLRALERAIWVAGTLVFGAFTLLVIVHVVARYTGFRSVTWSYEFSRYALIWLTFVFTAVLVRSDEHLKITVGFQRLPERAQYWVRLVELGLVVGVGLVFAVYGYRYATVNGFFSTSPVTGIPMFWPYLVFPTTGVLVVLFAVDKIAAIVLDPSTIRRDHDRQFGVEEADE